MQLQLRFAASALACLLMAEPVIVSQTNEATSGKVRGVVLDSTGKPLPDANVYLMPAEEMTKQIRTIADASGRFELKDIPVGDAYISAYKESDGHPYNFFSFYIMPGDHVPIKIHVNGDSTQDVTLQLGARAARLHLNITDRLGNQVKIDAELIFARSDFPQGYRRSVESGTADIMVPPVPFTLRIEAQGYDPWESGPLDPKSGETLNLGAQLRRKSQNAQ